MSKRTKITEKRKRNKLVESKRQDTTRLFQLRSQKYASITPDNINRLKGEPVDVIEQVLVRLHTKRKLPTVLDKAFPSIRRFNWTAPADRFTKSFATEAKWSLARIGANHVKLNALLNRRRAFTTQLLLNELETAESTLNLCTQHCGVSTWSLEMELLLAEYRGGFENNRAVLSRILERELHHNEHLLAEFSSQRVDTTLSPLQYMRSVGSFLNNGDYAASHPSLPFLLAFTLSPQYLQSGQLQRDHAAYFLYTLSTRPLIDHYLACIRLFRHALCNGDDSLVETISGGEQLSRITDCDIDTLLICGFSKARHNHNDIIYEAYALYSSGRYQDLIHLAAHNIARDPLTFGWYELLARASAITRAPLPDCLPPNSKARSLLHTVRAAFSYNELIDRAVSGLLKDSIALEGTPLGYQITGFCYRMAPQHKLQRHSTDVIHDQHIVPAKVAFLPTMARTASLKHLAASFQPESATVAQAMCNKVTGNEETLDRLPLDSRLTLQLSAEVDQFAGRPRQAIEGYMKLLADRTLSRPQIADAVRGAFACALHLRDFNTAAAIVSSTSLDPMALLNLVDLDAAATAYPSLASAIDKRSIAWPIIFMLDSVHGNTRPEDVFTAFANFVESTGCARPSHIGRDGVFTYGLPQYLFFLRWVCYPSLLDSDIEYDGTTDVEGERVSILQLLQELDPDSSVVFAEEISQLQQQLAVRKAVRHVAKSKIHFNTEGIEKSLDKAYTERFERYCAMTRLSESSRKSVELHWEPSAQKQDLITEAHVALFRELFHELRYAFLFSNEHGLDWADFEIVGILSVWKLV